MPLVRLEERLDGIAILILDDPPSRNAMSEEMASEFETLVKSLMTRDDLRVLVLTGAGEAFSSGGHLKMLEEKIKISRENNVALMEKFYSQFLCLYELPMPVIAQMNGHAAGAGLCLALACDLRFCSEEASLSLHFVQLGLHPGMGVTYFLPRIVGRARAAELLYAGRRIKPDFALEIGLVNEVHPKVRLEERVLVVAKEIAAAGPQAVRSLKASLRESYSRTLSECLKREAEAQANDYVGPEFREGILAAREKRAPRF